MAEVVASPFMMKYSCCVSTLHMSPSIDHDNPFVICPTPVVLFHCPGHLLYKDTLASSGWATRLCTCHIRGPAGPFVSAPLRSQAKGERSKGASEYHFLTLVIPGPSCKRAVCVMCVLCCAVLNCTTYCIILCPLPPAPAPESVSTVRTREIGTP